MAMSIAKIPLEVQVETVEWPGANQGRVFLIFSAIFVSPAKTVFTLGAMITKLRFMLFILLNGITAHRCQPVRRDHRDDALPLIPKTP